MLTPDLFQEVTRLSDLLRAKFSPSEFIPGCEVMSITDLSQYAANNGWVEAICGQHNQQRVRWKSAETVIVGDFIDVIYFPDRRLFEAWGLGGAGAIAGAGGWPYANVLTVSTTDADAAHATIDAAIAAASDGDVILLDAETFSLSTTITVDKALTITSFGGTVITSSVAGPTFELTDAAGATLSNLTIRNTGAGAKSGCVKWAVDDVIIRDCLLEKLSGASTVSYCLWQLGGSGHIIDTNAECTDPPGDNYAYLNDTADASITLTRGNFQGLTSEVFTARAGSNLIGEFFAANDVSWAGTSSGWYFDSGDLAALGASTVNGYAREIVTPNPFINGALQFWQRGTSFAAIANLAYSADRFRYVQIGGLVHTISQSTDVPTVAEAEVLLPYSMLVDCTTSAASMSTAGLVYITQAIEGSNFLNLAQRQFTLSFWVKATKTGVYCVSFRNTGANRSYVGEYTVNTTATWEYKTITVSASPTAGTWDYGSGIGLQVSWALGVGTDYHTTAGAWQTGNYFGTSSQVNACDSTSNDFRLTGIKIEPGAVATPFLLPDYQQEKARCQRYCFALDASTTASQGQGAKVTTITIAIVLKTPVTMRIAPTAIAHNITGYTAGTPGTTTAALIDYVANNFFTLTGTFNVGFGNASREYVTLLFSAGTSWNGAQGSLATLQLGPGVVATLSAEF